MPYMIVNAEDRGFKIYRFLTDIRIGRHPDSDIILTSAEGKTISRHHARVLCDENGFLLIDSSLNGTRVNNLLIEEHRLCHGDQFQIADYLFTFIDESIVEPDSAANGELTLSHTLSGEGRFDKTERVMGCMAIEDQASDATLKARLKSAGTVVEDERMLAIFRDIHAVSHINVPILILGEPGTGKEKVAQAIHDFSEAAGEFVPVNCSAIPETLFESELFGSVKGAFFEATTKSGKLELADNGTLFLDEIGDMGLGCQPKLLRFLESRSISRLGETRVRNLNIRIVAATNQDLNQMIQTRKFRPDLFQRLACVKLNIPPLRRRVKDILPLANFFIDDYCRQYGFGPMEISKPAAQLMQSYHWPGNVRELANTMLNVSVRKRGGRIVPEDLTSASEEIGACAIEGGSDFLCLKAMEKEHIKKVLKQTSNNKTKACALLGISRDTLYKKIQKYNIGHPD